MALTIPLSGRLDSIIATAVQQGHVYCHITLSNGGGFDYVLTAAAGDCLVGTKAPAPDVPVLVPYGAIAEIDFQQIS